VSIVEDLTRTIYDLRAGTIAGGDLDIDALFDIERSIFRRRQRVGWKHRVADTGAMAITSWISVEAQNGLTATRHLASVILTTGNSVTISTGQKREECQGGVENMRYFETSS
jgi:hypothetical protein